MSWVRTDERKRIVDANEEGGAGWIHVYADMRGWKLFDEDVPVYKLTDGGTVARRTDQEIKKDKKGKR